MGLYFRSFRARLLTFVLALVVLIQAAVFASVQTASVSEARRNVDEALMLTASAFNRSLETRERILRERARLLSADFALKEAAAIRDRATLLSVLENHRDRVAADVMMLLDMSGHVLANTLAGDESRIDSLIDPLIAIASKSDFGEASAIVFLDDVPYQLVVVPLFAPDPVAWIAIGFAIRDAFARELQRETNSHVSLLRREADEWRAFCSTLPAPLQRSLEASFARLRPEPDKTVSLDLHGDAFVSYVTSLRGVELELVAVLQRSLHDALASSRRLRTVLLFVFTASLALSVVGGLLIALRVTRPVGVLASGARRIRAGDYTEPIAVEQRDELGALATAFNNMMTGLVERDRVRDVLGRVVSPEIAEELLSKRIELGGEERIASVFFTDIRSFTTLATREEPQRLVKILNVFLTGASAAIEKHGGVVEEFMGDGVKALFGAPVPQQDHALRSTRAALELQTSLAAINARIESLGGKSLSVGIGVHTGIVVAGRMGSLTRLKYTAVGDAVNVASRLEGLTQRYGVGIIVSEATRDSCPEICFREIDRVRVKGRSAAVRIFEPVGRADELSGSQVERIELHHSALERYRDRDWGAAEKRFQELAKLEPNSVLYSLFLERIEKLRNLPDPSDWDGTFNFDDK